jgi:aldose 1-epimerase
MGAQLSIHPFGEWEGRLINRYTVTETAGIQVSIINYGATVTSMIVPDRNGAPADVVLGFDTMEGYLNAGEYYIGGICGRYANRIAGGRFRINGHMYQLTGNNEGHCLHGGKKGFDKVFWEAEPLPGNDGVKFTYRSKDGEEGFPGNMTVAVTYRVEKSALQIIYSAKTDKASPVNLTSHCYFNLSGGTQNTIFDHELRLIATQFVEVDLSLIPTGKLAEVKGTRMDFTRMRKAGDFLQNNGEYDHCWVLNREKGSLIKAAELIHKQSGRGMDVYTSQPGIHFYSGHQLSESAGTMSVRNNIGKYAGICLEAQHFPDSPNRPHFPCTVILPGQCYEEKTVYQFYNI